MPSLRKRAAPAASRVAGGRVGVEHEPTPHERLKSIEKEINRRQITEDSEAVERQWFYNQNPREDTNPHREHREMNLQHGGSVAPEAAAALHVPPAPEALPHGVPGMDDAEVQGRLADAQQVTAQSMGVAQPAPQMNTLLAQAQALRQAEMARDQHQHVLAQLGAHMRPNDGPVVTDMQPPQQQPPMQMTPAEQEVLQLHPQISTHQAYAQLASMTVAEMARRGHPRGSQDYESGLRPAFEKLLDKARKAAAPPAAERSEPESEPEEKYIPRSAPVSRSGGISEVGPIGRDGKVTLSAQEREHARMSGVPESVYAAQKLRLQQLKNSGFYEDERG